MYILIINIFIVMPSNIVITPASGLIAFTSSSGNTQNINQNGDGTITFSGATTGVGIGVSPAFPLDLLTNSSGTFNTISQFRNTDYTSSNRSFIRVRQQISEGSSSSSYFGMGQDNNLYIIANDSARGGDLIINGSTGAATFSNSVSIGGHLTGNGVNPGGLGGSRYVIDWSGGYSRFFSYGANSSTNGGIVFNTQRSDGTNSIDALSIAPSGAATFTSTNASLNVVTIFSPPTGGNVNLQCQSNSSGNTAYGGLNVISSTGKAGYLTCGDNSFTAGNYFAQASYVTLAATTGAGIKLRVNADDTLGITIPINGNVLIGSVTDQGTWKAQITGNMFIRGNDATSSNSGLYMDNSSGTLLFKVRNDGAVYTGNASVSPYNNTTATAANVVVTATDGNLARSTASSIRFKENINDWDGNGLDTILALKPKIFKYKKDYYDKSDVNFLGLIAEDVAEVSPYLADYENEDRTGQVENVRYANIVVPLIKAIQELQTRITQLENK